MNQQIERRHNLQTDKWINRWTDRQIDEQVEKHTNGQTDRVF